MIVFEQALTGGNGYHVRLNITVRQSRVGRISTIAG
jgi:hypothetical protein